MDRAYVDKGFNGQSWFRVRETYLKQEKMGTREQTYAAIKKLLASLEDPFTRFLDPEQYDQLRRGTSGSVTGVGLEVAFAGSAGAKQPAQLMVCYYGLQLLLILFLHVPAGCLSRTGYRLGCTEMRIMQVVTPTPGGPASRAGIRAQDRILAIDAKGVADQSLYDIAARLQGSPGSTVVLTVQPKNSTAAKDIELTRYDLPPGILRTICTVFLELLPSGTQSQLFRSCISFLDMVPLLAGNEYRSLQ